MFLYRPLRQEDSGSSFPWDVCWLYEAGRVHQSWWGPVDICPEELDSLFSDWTRSILVLLSRFLVWENTNLIM